MPPRSVAHSTRENSMSAELVPAAGRVVTRQDNRPPNAIERSSDTLASVNAYLSAHPVVQTEAEAKEGARLIKQSKAAEADMESERDGRVRPLNETVAAINSEYRAPKAVLVKVKTELTRRVEDFARAEERRRAAEAAEQRKRAEEAERLAREAEAKERQAREEAEVGVIGVDVLGATVEADASFRDFEKASRDASRAAKDVSVKLGTGMGRALSMRTKETLLVTDAAAAMKAIGLTPKIKEALLAGARDYRREWDALPPGITSKTERSL